MVRSLSIPTGVFVAAMCAAWAGDSNSTAWTLLQARCGKCHSGVEAAAKLDLRTRSGLLKGGTHGPALIAGAAEKSLLFERVRSGQMPPGGPRLNEEELRQIARSEERRVGK